MGDMDKISEDFNIEKKLKQLQNEAIIVELQLNRYSYEGIKGHDQIRDQLMDAITSADESVPKKILLYGVVGCGKSYLIKSVGKKISEDNSVNFYSVQSCTLKSRWFNFSGRFVDLFNLAEKSQPSVLFFDDIDSLFGESEPEISEKLKDLREEFVKCIQMTGSKVIVVAAADHPSTIHSDVLNCFKKFIPMHLADEKSRADLFRHMFLSCSNSLNEENYQTLASKTEGFTKNDIASLINCAIMHQWRKVRDATHFCRGKGSVLDQPDVTSDNLLAPCTPEHPDAIEMNFTDISEDELQSPIVNMEDVLSILDEVRTSVSEVDLQKISDFVPPIN